MITTPAKNKNSKKLSRPLSRRLSWAALALAVAIAADSGSLTLAAEASKQPSPPSDHSQWAAQMQSLYHTLSALLTDVSSDKRFKDPSLKKQIDREAEDLAKFTHDLGRKRVLPPDADPTLGLIAALLAQESKRAVTELKRDNRTYARNILRTLPGYCVACHTRNSSGPQFNQEMTPDMALRPTTDSLTPLEKGEFYAASRQFDLAQAEYLKIISDLKVGAAYSYDWDRAVRQALNIAVRVKQDPHQAMSIVDTILSLKHAPTSIQLDSRVWKKSIDAWKNEHKRDALSDDGRYSEAVRLMAEAREIQRYPMDRTADIVYLRASAAAHDYLQKAKDNSHVSDALLLEGLSYEVLAPLKTDDLHNLYYEACIRKSPHTATATLCYQRIEQSTLFGYTGSLGTDVPEDVLKKLAQLKAMALLSDQSNIQL